MTQTSREVGNWTLAFLYILQCEACFALETQSAVPLGNIRWRMERIGMSVCALIFFNCVHMCSREYLCVSSLYLVSA